jgi:hypothetical protein
VEQKYAGLALHLLTVVLLAVIAFELANPAKAPTATADARDYSGDIRSLQSEVQRSNQALGAICQLETLAYKDAHPGVYGSPMGATCP